MTTPWPLEPREDGELIDDDIWDAEITTPLNELNDRTVVVEDRTTNATYGNNALSDRIGILEDHRPNDRADIDALETLTGDGTHGNLALDSRLDAVEPDVTALNSLTGDGTHGNLALDERLGTGVGTGTDPETGTATAQFEDLRDRVTAVEGATGVAYSTHIFRQSTAQTIPTGSSSADWYRILFDTIVVWEPDTDVTAATVSFNGQDGTEFTFHKSGIWRATFNNSLSTTSSDARILMSVSSDPNDDSTGRNIYSEHVHAGSVGASPYADNISGLIEIATSGTISAWVWHSKSGGWDTSTNDGRITISFEWVAPLPST